MRIAMTVGCFSAGEADQLRRKIGSWSLHKEVGPIVKKFEDGMRRGGVEEHFITQIVGHLKGFSNYGFPESHAVSFALLAYASSFIKCHHKEAFYTALFNSQPMGFYSIHALLHSARREGIEFRPIDINRSDWDSQLEATAHAGVWAIRLGMHLVGGLSQKGAERILNIRKQQGPWTDLNQFLRQNISHKNDLTALAAANALEGFGIARAQAIWLAEAVPFAPVLDHEHPYDFGQESEQQRVERDFASFATTLGKHPSQLLREGYWTYDVAPSKLDLAVHLGQKADRSIVYVFGLVLVRQAPLTAKGMEFFTLEDETGFINLVFNPQTLALYKNIAHTQSFLCIKGRLQRTQEGHSILVQQVLERQLKDPKLTAIKDRPARSNDVTKTPETFRKLPPARNFH